MARMLLPEGMTVCRANARLHYCPMLIGIAIAFSGDDWHPSTNDINVVLRFVASNADLKWSFEGDGGSRKGGERKEILATSCHEIT